LAERSEDMKKGFLEIKTDDSAEMILVKIALLKLEHRVDSLEEIVRGYEFPEDKEVKLESKSTIPEM